MTCTSCVGYDSYWDCKWWWDASIKTDCRNRCIYQNSVKEYYWDGLDADNENDRDWGYYNFNLRYTTGADTHYWIGGDSTPTMFSLACGPCVNKVVTVDDPTYEFVWTIG